MTIENDSLSESEFIKFLTSAFQNMATALKSGGVFYIWYAARNEGAFTGALTGAGLQLREQLIWVKNQFTLGRSDYQWRHEPCLYGWKDGTHFFTNSRSETTVIDDTPEFDHLSKAEAIELLRSIYETGVATTSIYDKKPTVNAIHPTMKPVTLIAYQVSNSSRRGEKVLDLFGGSGTTLIACEQLRRKCYMMECDPHYADVIIDRWESYTGQKAVLLNG